jgi:crotonobetainyl-CoA:carnitine CoA-transferase CaiB-like acyl-CoA transferase
VLELETILNHPHLAGRSLHVAPPEGASAAQRVVAAPIRMSDTPVAVRRSAPTLGEHTAAVRASLRARKGWPADAGAQ